MTEVWLQLGSFLGLLVLGYVAGRRSEARHIADLRARERLTAWLPAVTLKKVPGLDDAADAQLVAGSVVVGIDYFKRFVAGLRGLVGGRVDGYAILMDRGRREAILRMKEAALAQGFDAVIRVRLETSTLASQAGNGNGTAGVEMLAYGTGVRWAAGTRPAALGGGAPQRLG